jgi:predicted nucleotidyltransferase
MAEITASFHWPTGGTPLFPGVAATDFEPVTEEILSEISRRIVAALHPQKIILFGSYAYGHPTSDSDVDLLVIMESTQRPADRQSAVTRLVRPRPFPIDILVRTPREVQLAVNLGDAFLTEILARGKILYG